MPALVAAPKKPTLTERSSASLEGFPCPDCNGKLRLATLTDFAAAGGRLIPIAMVNVAYLALAGLCWMLARPHTWSGDLAGWLGRPKPDPFGIHVDEDDERPTQLRPDTSRDGHPMTSGAEP